MRWIHDQIDRASQRMTFTYRVIPRLSLGVEYNPKVGEIGPLMNLVAVKETKFRPAVLFGLSSDRIGTPDGTAYFATVSKNLEQQLRWPVSPYIGVAYGTYEDKFDAIGGVHVGLGAGFSTTLLYDGKKVHPTLAYRFLDRHVVTLLWVATQDVGLSYSVAF